MTDISVIRPLRWSFWWRIYPSYGTQRVKRTAQTISTSWPGKSLTGQAHKRGILNGSNFRAHNNKINFEWNHKQENIEKALTMENPSSDEITSTLDPCLQGNLHKKEVNWWDTGQQVHRDLTTNCTKLWKNKNKSVIQHCRVPKSVDGPSLDRSYYSQRKPILFLFFDSSSSHIAKLVACTRYVLDINVAHARNACWAGEAAEMFRPVDVESFQSQQCRWRSRLHSKRLHVVKPFLT